MSTATYKCACCGDPFIARVADRKRGWARFCSKSCKAVKQEARTGQNRSQEQRQERGGFGLPMFYSAQKFDNTEL
jgi:hypothetical protein